MLSFPMSSLSAALLTIVLAAILSGPAFASDTPAPAPPLATIIERVVAQDEATRKALQSMQYEQTNLTQQLDAKNQVTRQEEERLIVRPGAPQEIQVVDVKGDHLPSDPDEAMQQAKGKEMERRKHDFSLRILITRFNIALAGTGNYLGQPAYILAFEPRPGQPYRDQTEKVLNQLHGQMWVSTRDYVILKTEATLVRPVSVAWIFARISTLDFHYELRSATSDFGPAWLQFAVEVDAPFIVIRQRQTVDMTHFERRGKLVSAAHPG
jgi:hypothetical protein